MMQPVLTIVDNLYTRGLSLCKRFGETESVTLSELWGWVREDFMQEPKEKRKFQAGRTDSATKTWKSKVFSIT